MQSAPSEPELPDRVPEGPGAVTPDLPPLDPGAPDLLTDAEGARPRRDSTEKHRSKEGHERQEGQEGQEGEQAEPSDQPAAGPGNAKPQESTD